MGSANFYEYKCKGCCEKWKKVIYVILIVLVLFLASFLVVFAVNGAHINNMSSSQANVFSSHKKFSQRLEKPYGSVAGSTALNKAYNLLSGHGFDLSYANSIGDFTTKKRKYVSVGNDIRFEPDQMSIVSDTQCKYSGTNANEYFVGASAQITAYQAKSQSFGEKMNVFLSDDFGMNPSDESMELSVIFGNTKMTSTSISVATKYGFQFESSSVAKLLSSKVDWKNPRVPFNFDRKFLKGLKKINVEFNDENERNRVVMNFFNDFGTHVIKHADFGAKCSSFVCMSSESTQFERETFLQTSHKNYSTAFGSESSSSQFGVHEKMTMANGFSYEIASKRCDGVIGVNPCDVSMKSDIDAPIMLRCQPLAIWEIEIKDFDLHCAKSNMFLSIVDYFKAARQCAKEQCKSKGSCVPNDDFWHGGVYDWNGNFDDYHAFFDDEICIQN